DGQQSYHETDELGAAIAYVEHLRNDEGVDHARIFKLAEVSFEFRPYFRVEIAENASLPAPPVVEAADDPAMEMDRDPLATAWAGGVAGWSGSVACLTTIRVVSTTAAPTTTRLMTNANNLQTLEGESPSPEEPTTPRQSWLRRWWWIVALVTVTSMVTAVVGGAMLIHVKYVIESPGGLYQTTDRISISGVSVYPTNDRIDLVTVSVDTRVTALEKFFA